MYTFHYLPPLDTFTFKHAADHAQHHRFFSCTTKLILRFFCFFFVILSSSFFYSFRSFVKISQLLIMMRGRPGADMDRSLFFSLDSSPFLLWFLSFIHIHLVSLCAYFFLMLRVSYKLFGKYLFPLLLLLLKKTFISCCVGAPGTDSSSSRECWTGQKCLGTGPWRRNQSSVIIISKLWIYFTRLYVWLN